VTEPSTNHQDVERRPTGAPLPDGQALRLDRGLPVLLVGQALIGLVFAVVQWQVANPAVIAGWLGLLAMVLAVQGFAGWHHGRGDAGSALSPRAWLSLFRAGAVGAGIVWGIAATLLYPDDDIARQCFLAFVVLAVGMGAVASLAADRMSVLATTAPAMLPLVARLAIEGGAIRVAMASVLAVVLVLIMASAFRADRRIREAVKPGDDDRRMSGNEAAVAARLNRLLSAGPGVVFTCVAGQGLAFTYMSPSIRALTGYDANAFAGDAGFWGRVLHPDDAPRVAEALSEVSAGRPGAVDFRFLCRDGAWRWMRFDLRPGIAPDGATAEILGAWTDVTERKQTEEALRRKSHTLDAAFLATPDGVTVSDATLTGVEANDRFFELFRFDKTAAFASGDPIMYGLMELARRGEYGPGDPVGLARARKAAVAEQVARLGTLQYERQLRDGRWFEGRITAIVGGGWITLYRDITDRMQAEMALKDLNATLERRVIERTEALAVSERRFRQLVESTGAVPYTFDPATKALSYVGPQAPQVLGTGVAAFTDTELWLRHLHEDDRQAVAAGRGRAIGSGSDMAIEYRFIDDAGRTRWIRDVMKVLRDGGDQPTGYGLLFDITDLKLREEAVAASRAKTEFLSSMSHELRTPLNAILGFAQLLQGDPQYPLADTQRDSVGQIVKAGDHLHALIDEVLDLSRIEAGKVTLSIEAVDLAALLSECLGYVGAMAGKRDIAIHLPRGDMAHAVRADYTRLRQVVLNLLSNAIKYNVRGGRVDVTVGPAGADMVRVTVTDTGTGIPKDRRDELFRPFARLGAEFTEIEGTGIGLSLSKQLTELMGGTIGFESAPGRGSRFWINLPRAEPTEDLPEPPGDSKPIAAVAEASELPFTVLYIEDNPANLLLMEQLVGRVPGARMVSAHTAELGLEMVDVEQPDVILIDINLPGMDGISAVRELKRRPDWARIPAIAISADAMPSTIQRGLEAGFEAYLTKPIRVQKVLAMLGELRDRTRVSQSVGC
jgi:PAS domain S-box-containing protein